jgi:hypothetical protein
MICCGAGRDIGIAVPNERSDLSDRLSAGMPHVANMAMLHFAQYTESRMHDSHLPDSGKRVSRGKAVA